MLWCYLTDYLTDIDTQIYDFVNIRFIMQLETYLEPSQTSADMGLFGKIVTDFSPLNVFAKNKLHRICSNDF